MNTSFTLKNVEIPVSEEQTIKIGELSTTVSDYKLLEGVQVLKELPAVARQLKDIIVEAIVDIEDATQPVFETCDCDCEGDNYTSSAQELPHNVRVDLAIRELADVLGVDPTQIKVVAPEQVDEESAKEEMPAF